MSSNTALFNRLKSGLEEAIAFAGENNTHTTIHHVKVADVDAKAIRTHLNMSQEKFSAYFGIPKTTLQNWEQHRREPDATAKLLLAVISKYPEQVHDAIQDDRV